MQIFGVDIGGSGIKGAPVDLDRGDLTQERFKVLTPHPATPDGVADGVKQVVEHFGTRPDRVGITFPGVVTGGAMIRTAANVDKSWIDVDARALLGGVSRKADKFLPLIKGIKAEIVPAQLQNNAGIVGAAMAAAQQG